MKKKPTVRRPYSSGIVSLVKAGKTSSVLTSKSPVNGITTHVYKGIISSRLNKFFPFVLKVGLHLESYYPSPWLRQRYRTKDLDV